MLKTSIRLTIVCLALVGLYRVAFEWVIPAYIDRTGKGVLRITLASPDGGFNAVLSTFSLGGALSPFCRDSIFVYPGNLDENAGMKREFQVYNGDCVSFEDHSASPQMKWASDSVLTVSAPMRIFAWQDPDLLIRGRDASGKIAIELYAHR